MAEVQKQPGAASEMAQRFVEFVMMQAQNALYMLGAIPGPGGEPAEPNFDVARILIDQLEMIKAKTTGNLSTQESEILDNALSRLRLAFVEAVHSTGEAPPAGPAAPAPKTAPAPKAAAEAPTPAEKSASDNDDKVRFRKSYG